MRIDGRSGAAFEAVAPPSLTFSGDGKHIAYAARRGGKWLVVRDGTPGQTWDAIGELAMSAHGERLAYAAEQGGHWQVVVDERAGPRFDALFGGVLRFSDDARHLVYAAADGKKARVVVDEQVGPWFDGVGLVKSSRDGTHVAYVARRDGSAYVVFDGVLGEPWEAVEQLVLGDRGRLAYVARNGSAVRVAWSRLGEPGVQTSVAYEAALGLVSSSDEQHLAWVGRLGGVDSLVVDGQPSERSPSSIEPTTLAFVPGSTELAFVARDADHRKRVIVGQRTSAPFDDIAGKGVVFSSDGRHLGFTGRRATSFFVVLDGVEQHSESWASRPVFSASGTRVAYLARRGRRMAILVDGKSHLVDVALDGTFAFSADETHWACLAGTADDRELSFVVDGERQGALDFEEVVSAAGRFSLDDVRRGRADDILRTWAAAEAELAAHRR